MISPQGGPVYRQLAAILRDDIRAGRILPGQLLPSETTLHQQSGYSRLTVRAAINLLRAEGLADLQFGRGVVVREPAEVTDLVPPAGASVTTRMPTAEERDEYDVAEGVPLFQVTSPDGTVEVFPGDRWRLVWPAT